MEMHDHSATPRGRAFLWGGLGLGLLLVAVLLTQGFGLLARRGGNASGAPPLLHQGAKIFIPEGSPLRGRLTLLPAPAVATSATFTVPGIVEADPARIAAVLPALGGRVSQLRVALGDRVQRGQILTLVDSPDLAQAYDDNDKARDSFALTAKNLERQEQQFKIGAASQRDLDQAHSDHAQAQAEYTRTRTRLQAVGAPEDAAAGARLLAVRAPVSGSVTTLSIAAGNMINDPTQPIMTVTDLSVVWVTALVAEKDAAAIGKDQDAEVILEADPAHTLHGKVLFVAAVLEADSRRNKTRIAFPNPNGTLKPNMFATVRLHGAAVRRVVLPSSALLMNNDRTSVFVATAPWTFERRIVDPQLEESSSVAIRAGVQPGEQVVVTGGILLND